MAFKPVMTAVKTIFASALVLCGISHLFPNTVHVKGTCTANEGHHVKIGTVNFAVPADCRKSFNFVVGKNYEFDVKTGMFDEPAVKTKTAHLLP